MQNEIHAKCQVRGGFWTFCQVSETRQIPPEPASQAGNASSNLVGATTRNPALSGDYCAFGHRPPYWLRQCLGPWAGRPRSEYDPPRRPGIDTRGYTNREPIATIIPVEAIHLGTAVGRPRSAAIPWAASPEEDPFRAPSGASAPSVAADRTEMDSPHPDMHALEYRYSRRSFGGLTSGRLPLFVTLRRGAGLGLKADVTHLDPRDPGDVGPAPFLGNLTGRGRRQTALVRALACGRLGHSRQDAIAGRSHVNTKKRIDDRGRGHRHDRSDGGGSSTGR